MHLGVQAARRDAATGYMRTTLTHETGSVSARKCPPSAAATVSVRLPAAEGALRGVGVHGRKETGGWTLTFGL